MKVNLEFLRTTCALSKPSLRFDHASKAFPITLCMNHNVDHTVKYS